MKMYLHSFCELLAKLYHRQKFFSPFFLAIGFYLKTKKRNKTWVVSMLVFIHGANVN